MGTYLGTPVKGQASFGHGAFCVERQRLIEAFLTAVHELNMLQHQQTHAVVEGDEDFARFDVLLHLAQEKKDNAKYAWIAHVESHGCGEGKD